MKSKTTRIMWFEPIVFLFFGMLHLHRVWALTDRVGYSNFWLSLMVNRGLLYFILMGIMSLLCIAGIVVFATNRGKNYWWRWFYILGGGYVLFDLFAILIGLSIWEQLIYWMFDISNLYWNVVWGCFIGLGFISFIIGLSITKKLNCSK